MSCSSATGLVWPHAWDQSHLASVFIISVFIISS